MVWAGSVCIIQYNTIHRLPGTCTSAHQHQRQHQSLGPFKRTVCLCIPLNRILLGQTAYPARAYQRDQCRTQSAGHGSGNAVLAAPDDPRAPLRSALALVVLGLSRHYPCRSTILSPPDAPVGRSSCLSSDFSGTTLLHIRLALLAIAGDSELSRPRHFRLNLSLPLSPSFFFF